MKIYANLKMNLNKDEVLNLRNNITESDDLIMIPSNIFLNDFSTFNLGAQDVSCFKNGSYTGDISASQLKSIGISYCLVGHSERRKNYCENNELFKLKIERLIENDITPILCVGENQGEDFVDVLNEQLSFLDSEIVDKIIIAYEPIWAIGTGLIPTVEKITEITDFIKSRWNTLVLYGGSVDENNIDILKIINNLDGFLVGKASCDSFKLNALLNSIRQK